MKALLNWVVAPAELRDLGRTTRLVTDGDRADGTVRIWQQGNGVLLAFGSGLTSHFRSTNSNRRHRRRHHHRIGADLSNLTTNEGKYTLHNVEVHATHIWLAGRKQIHRLPDVPLRPEIMSSYQQIPHPAMLPRQSARRPPP